MEVFFLKAVKYIYNILFYVCILFLEYVHL